MINITNENGRAVFYKDNEFMHSFPASQLGVEVLTAASVRVSCTVNMHHNKVVTVDGTTVNGVSYSTSEELASELSSFNAGGGAPGEGVQSVTGDGVGGTPENVVLSWPEPVTWDTLPEKPAFVASGANAGAARTSLGLGSAATTNISAYATAGQGVLAGSALQPADAVDVPEAGKVVKYSNIGAVNTTEPQFPENAVNLAFLNERVPIPPAVGNYRLESVDGVVSWVEIV